LGRAGPKSLRWRRVWPKWIRLFPICVILPRFCRSTSNGTSVIKDIHLKVWPFASCLSRPLKVIKTGTHQSAVYDFLFTFHGNHQSISHRFRDKRRFQLRGFLLKLDIAIISMLGVKKKLEWWSYRIEKKIDDIFSRLDTIYESGL